MSQGKVPNALEYHERLLQVIQPGTLKNKIRRVKPDESKTADQLYRFLTQNVNSGLTDDEKEELPTPEQVFGMEQTEVESSTTPAEDVLPDAVPVQVDNASGQNVAQSQGTRMKIDPLVWDFHHLLEVHFRKNRQISDLLRQSLYPRKSLNKGSLDEYFANLRSAKIDIPARSKLKGGLVQVVDDIYNKLGLPDDQQETSVQEAVQEEKMSDETGDSPSDSTPDFVDELLDLDEGVESNDLSTAEIEKIADTVDKDPEEAESAHVTQPISKTTSVVKQSKSAFVWPNWIRMLVPIIVFGSLLAVSIAFSPADQRLGKVIMAIIAAAVINTVWLALTDDEKIYVRLPKWRAVTKKYSVDPKYGDLVFILVALGLAIFAITQSSDLWTYGLAIAAYMLLRLAFNFWADREAPDEEAPKIYPNRGRNTLIFAVVALVLLLVVSIGILNQGSVQIIGEQVATQIATHEQIVQPTINEQVPTVQFVATSIPTDTLVPVIATLPPATPSPEPTATLPSATVTRSLCDIFPTGEGC